MARGKWWEPNLPKRKRNIEDIKAEVEKMALRISLKENSYDTVMTLESSNDS